MRVATTFRSFHSVIYSIFGLFSVSPKRRFSLSLSIRLFSLLTIEFIHFALLLLNDGLISIKFTGKRFVISSFWVGSVLIFVLFRQFEREPQLKWEKTDIDSLKKKERKNGEHRKNRIGNNLNWNSISTENLLEMLVHFFALTFVRLFSLVHLRFYVLSEQVFFCSYFVWNIAIRLKTSKTTTFTVLLQFLMIPDIFINSFCNYFFSSSFYFEFVLLPFTCRFSIDFW